MKGKQGPQDFAETAFSVFQQAVGDAEREPAPVKDAKAVERGKARAEKLSDEDRSKIARNAAAKAVGALACFGKRHAPMLVT